jgi:hypothetical protein
MVKIGEKEKDGWKGHENHEDQKGEISLTSAIKCVEFVKKWYPYIFENSQRDGMLIFFLE